MTLLTCALLALPPSAAADPPPPGPRPFVVTVVDDQTGRGVPLVELRTVNEVRYVTDSAGVAAVVEPGLNGLSTWFHVRSHGYEFAADGFGYRGKALTVTEGGEATLKIHRVNIAERLYRVIGGGIYRDSVLVGRTPPIRQPLLNARVLGSDSVLNAVYGGKLHWFWGDTNRPGYPLGNFHTPGARSELPGQGGLDPEVGVDLSYFVDANGFAAETAHLPGEGPTWLGGLTVLADAKGRERLVAGYAKIRPPMETYEIGLVEFDGETHKFAKVATFPLDAPVRPEGHTILTVEDGVTYVQFSQPLPLARVRADFDSMKDISKYEAYTCLETHSRLGKGTPKVDRGPDGRARYAWRPDTPVVGPAEQAKLIRDGHLKDGEVLFALRDATTDRPFQAHSGSVYWNAYRGRWVLICVELGGTTSLLGEVWYAEADTPLGPWAYARKVLTHDKYSFYNPKQHPYFAKDGGRTIFFEGTYTTTFSGNDSPTPRYDYNQIMYKLDLADPRLNLPVPVYPTAEGSFAVGPAHAGRGPAPFFALERPGEETVPVVATPREEGGYALHAADKGKPSDGVVVFHALPAEGRNPPKALMPLYELTRDKGGAIVHETSPTRDGARASRPVCLVWRAPTSVRLPAAPARP